MPDICYKGWLIQSPPVNDFHRREFKYSDGSVGQLRLCPDQYGFPSYPFHPSYEKLPPVRPPADNSAKEKPVEPVRKSSTSANKAYPASCEILSASVNVSAAPAAQQDPPATPEGILSNLYSNYAALCNEVTQEAQDAFLASMNAALAGGLITLEWGGPSFRADSFSVNDGVGSFEDRNELDPLTEQDVFDDPNEPDTFDEFGNPVRFNEFGEEVLCEDLFDPPQEEDFGEEMLEQEFFDAILDGRIWDEDYF